MEGIEERISKSEPYQLKFSGKGNLRSVGAASDFYEIRKTNDRVVTVRFVPAESQGGKSSRSNEPPRRKQRGILEYVGFLTSLRAAGNCTLRD